jgi:hypothetical protein
MAIRTCDDRLLGDISTARLDAICEQLEIQRLLRVEGDNYLSCYGFDGRLFLCQNDGSHRFAAAQYIAYRLGAAVPVSGRLKTVMLNEAAVDELNSGYRVFAMPDREADGRQLRYRMRDALEALQATFYRRDLPFPYSGQGAAILLRARSIDRRWSRRS